MHRNKYCACMYQNDELIACFLLTHKQSKARQGKARRYKTYVPSSSDELDPMYTEKGKRMINGIDTGDEYDNNRLVTYIS